jgi:hypothetical protein
VGSAVVVVLLVIMEETTVWEFLELPLLLLLIGSSRKRSVEAGATRNGVCSSSASRNTDDDEDGDCEDEEEPSPETEEYTGPLPLFRCLLGPAAAEGS